jgi:mRNA interferase MazF
MRRAQQVPEPLRGEVWYADLGTTIGHEQAGDRPVLVVSDNRFNRSLAGLVIVLPITTTHRGLPAHVPILPPEGGIRRSSVILCDAIRSVSKQRLSARWGPVSEATLAQVEECMRLLLSM